jgi:hypothetical protein
LIRSISLSILSSTSELCGEFEVFDMSQP